MISTATIEKLPDGAVVVNFSGRLTLGTSLKLIESQLQPLLEESASRVVFDMANVDYIDSAGLGMIVLFHGQISSRNGSLRLCGVNPTIRQLLAMTRTDSFLVIDDSREGSLASLQ
jgi:anti-sigma B factor antagonist